ncbi:MAG TPA: glycosyltransferase family 2 protein [Actinomycetota bacterium]|nr:glycosyltransferase family 2 protein [Actinomycetota bacterium]
MTDVSVVVVNYNAGEAILDCLRALETESPAEIVVIDNASTDGSGYAVAREHPGVRLVRNRDNVGFGPAVNQGVGQTRSPYVFVLNPDAVVRRGSLRALAAALDDHPKAGAVGALVLNPDGSVQPTKRAFPTLWQSALHGLLGVVWPNNPGTRAYTLADAPIDAPAVVDWVAGTAVAVRRDAFEALGGFDEGFFLFVSDVDLCRRLWDAGWEVWFEPAAVVEHAWGTSWTQRPLKFMWMHQRNLWRYVKKHRRGAWVLAYPFIALALGLRFVLLAIRWVFTRRSVPSHRTAGSRT